MCCTEGLTRILVFVANFAFLLVGVALLALGILHTVNYNHYIDAIPKDYQLVQHVPTIAIVVGSIIFVIAFLGCCGTLKSSTCMLTTYASILLLIFFAQVALGIFGLVTIKDDTDLKKNIEASVQTLFSKYGPNNETNKVIDVIQDNLECCGVTGPTFWISIGQSVPKSCFADGALLPYTQGCSSALLNFVMSSVRMIAIVALAISLTEIVGAVLALFLANCIRANQRKGAYY
ncbi:23 kDa integral membrane protein-like [Anthonomus grandis grandis]|uniref:23 kDa integral membrane protein-like n=1 Tax=Anthonomus grandis grandis TaxID=2921223 RepID=UPI00216513FD|nr:23 kDa integral membrane protein-like [Anthonomus grandis grandis]